MTGPQLDERRREALAEALMADDEPALAQLCAQQGPGSDAELRGLRHAASLAAAAFVDGAEPMPPSLRARLMTIGEAFCAGRRHGGGAAERARK